jgi:hypothetical protein
MARNLTIAAGIALTLATLLGLATAASAKSRKPPIIQLPPKSCLWISSGTRVPSGAYLKDGDGSLWKCRDGWFTCVRHCPGDPRS